MTMTFTTKNERLFREILELLKLDSSATYEVEHERVEQNYTEQKGAIRVALEQIRRGEVERFSSFEEFEKEMMR